MNALGVGIVGLGGMGHLHASTLEEIGATVVAGADIAPDARADFGAAFDATCYEDHDDLVADDAVDAVVVTTPNRFHEPAAVAALEAGLDVLVEKPLAHTYESAQRIADTARAARGHCMVGFHNRYAGSARLFTAQKERGRFGEIEHVEANYVRRRGVPGTGSWFTDRELAGGGALIDIGVHALDLALYTMDFPDIVEVSGTTRSAFADRDDYADPDAFGGESVGQRESYDVDDAATALLRSADGRTISLEAAWASNREPSMEMRVRGAEAGAAFEIGEDDCQILDAGTAGTDHYEDTVLSTDAASPGYRVQDERFVDSVRSDTAPVGNTIAQALQVQRIVDAIYESAARNRSVQLDSTEELTAATAQPPEPQYQ